MKDLKTIFRELISKITLHESEDEIKTIALILLEKVFGITRTDVMTGRPVTISPVISDKLIQLVDRINNGEPVQYVVGEAFFYGRKFIVNRSVLIPRPETEDIIRTVLSWRKSHDPARSVRVLDIGTGSGCIPITLSLELNGLRCFAIDVSADALAVALSNAKALGGNVSFIQHDILSGPIRIANVDVIVSNPPYVTMAEMNGMRRNVLDFEPHLALFVPNDDPLRFYRAIVNQAAYSLSDAGLIAVEINEKYGAAVCDLFMTSGLKDVQVIKDVAGKDRIVKGLKK